MEENLTFTRYAVCISDENENKRYITYAADTCPYIADAALFAKKKSAYDTLSDFEDYLDNASTPWPQELNGLGHGIKYSIVEIECSVVNQNKA